MTAPVSAKEPHKPLSLVNILTLQREAVYMRLQGLPPRSHRAVALRAKMAILTNELLACEIAAK